MFVVFDHLGDNLVDVARDGVVGDLVDRGFGVRVDRDDHRRLVHAGRVLDLARNAAGDVELRTHRDARLAHLARMLREARVDSGAAGAHFAAQYVGQFMHQPEVLPGTHTVAAGDDDACAKRPVSYESLERAVSSIEQTLLSSYDREIPSVRIGELTMQELKKIDEVAYVRFASVYRQFADVESFFNELKKLMGDRKEPQK